MCAHAFGVGVHLPELGDVGHVNTPHLAGPDAAVRDLDDLPPVGSSLRLTVLGRSNGGQLRLAVRRPDDDATDPPAPRPGGARSSCPSVLADRAGGYRPRMSDDGVLSVEQAYEAAYRYLMQYLAREPESESLRFMAIAMQPTPPHRSNDPGSWDDFLDCVQRTRARAPLPSPFREDDGTSGQAPG